MKVLREGPVRITKATIEAAWRRRSGLTRLVIGDASCRGLALVVNAGSMSWVFSYKPRGRDAVTGKRFSSRAITIGSPASHSPDDARDAANVLKGQAKAGADPAVERRTRIAADAQRRGRTLDRLVKLYGEALPVRPKLRGTGIVSAKHAADELAHTRAAISEMKAGDRPATDLTIGDLRQLLHAFASRPATARARFGAISRFFDWCQDEDYLAVNPCALVAKGRRPRVPSPRSHYLRPTDLAQIWHSAGEAAELKDVHRDLVRFLIAVPCRRNEAARMDWAHVDLDAQTWTLPGKLTKNGEPHRLHLHRLALVLLQERHRAANHPKQGLVFPAPRAKKPVDTFSHMKSSLGANTGIMDWRWHDFRRSFASALGEAGIPEPVADAVLNHRQAATRGGVLGVYQRASRWPEQMAAMQAWGEMLSAELAKQPTDEGHLAYEAPPSGLTAAQAQI